MNILCRLLSHTWRYLQGRDGIARMCIRCSRTEWQR